MNKLFIIGNGFDLAHGLDTSYDDFRIFLEQTYAEAEASSIIPEEVLHPRGGRYFHPEKMFSLYLYLVENAANDQWSDLESALGRLSYGDCFPDEPLHLDKDGDPDFFKNVYVLEDMSEPLCEIFKKLPDFLNDWIASIAIEGVVFPNKKFNELIDRENDYFLTFNYN
ncbi:AbiH family protein [Deferribacteres bacterium DY0037]